MFINDISVGLSISYHLYADDLQIYAPCELDGLAECAERVNADIDYISQWARANRLTLNASKSQAILFCSSYWNSIDTSVICCRLNGEVIPLQDEVKNLGLILDKNLNFEKSTQSILCRVYSSLRRLWPIHSIADSLIRRKIVMALCLPHFIYADVVRYRLGYEQMRRLELGFNACTRYVHKLKRFEHISDYSNSLLGCSFKQYLDLRALLFIYNVIKGPTPDYLKGKISFVGSSRTRHLRSRLPRTSQMSSSIFVQGIRLWNSMPLGMRNSGSVVSFKHAYLTYID